MSYRIGSFPGGRTNLFSVKISQLARIGRNFIEACWMLNLVLLGLIRPLDSRIENFVAALVLVSVEPEKQSNIEVMVDLLLSLASSNTILIMKNNSLFLFLYKFTTSSSIVIMIASTFHYKNKNQTIFE